MFEFLRYLMEYLHLIKLPFLLEVVHLGHIMRLCPLTNIWVLQACQTWHYHNIFTCNQRVRISTHQEDILMDHLCQSKAMYLTHIKGMCWYTHDIRYLKIPLIIYLFRGNMYSTYKQFNNIGLNSFIKKRLIQYLIPFVIKNYFFLLV